MLNLFSQIVTGKTTIKLVKNDEMIDVEIEIAKLFNEYFVNIVKKTRTIYKRTKCNFHSEVEIAIAKYGNHPSIIAITEKMAKPDNTTFDFDFTSHEETVKEVK